MTVPMRTPMVAIVVTALVGGAMAQERRDPTDPSVRAPAFEYVSPYSNYRPYEDLKLAPWRQLNERVRGLGGHAGHIRDGATGAAKPSASPAGPISRPEPREEGMPLQSPSIPRSDHSIHKH